MLVNSKPHFTSTARGIFGTAFARLSVRGHRAPSRSVVRRSSRRLDAAGSPLQPANCAVYVPWWLGSRVVSVLDSGAEGLGFKS